MDPVEMEWLFEAVMQIFSSPEWIASLGFFIDDNCKWFADEEENAFRHTELHQEYCSLAESILERHLADLGVAPEQFVALCEWGRDRSNVNRKVFDQIMAIDDFLSAARAARAGSAMRLTRGGGGGDGGGAAFKTMMMKRNMQLNQEVIEMLTKGGQSLAPPADPEEEELMLRAALRLSETEAAVEDAWRRKHRDEEGAGEGGSPATPPRGETKLADETPVKPSPPPQREHAVAGEAGAADAVGGRAASPDEEGDDDDDDDDDDDALTQAQLRDARLRAQLAELEHDIASEGARLQTLERQVNEVADTAVPGEVEEPVLRPAASEAKVPERAEAPEGKHAEPEPEVAPTAAPRVSKAEGKEEEKAADAPAKARTYVPASNRTTASKATRLPPVRAPIALPPVRAPGQLPSREALHEMAREFERSKREAERVLAERPAPAPAPVARAPAPAPAPAGTAGGAQDQDAELERRRAYLQRQRERLLAIRRQQQEQGEPLGGQGAAAGAAGAAGAASPRPTASGAAYGGEGKESHLETEEERKRRELSESLASRLRAEVEGESSQRSLERQTHEILDLTEKLRQVEALRRQSQESQQEVEARLRAKASSQMANARYSGFQQC